MAGRTRWILLIAVMIILLVVPVPVMAKGKTKLSIKSRTISKEESFRISLVGKSGKIKTKNIKWKMADPGIAVITRKEKKQIRILGKSEGVTRLTARYKGKTYTCKVVVTGAEEDNQEDDTEKPDDSDNELMKQIEENTRKVEQKIEDFKSRYLSEGMSEYQKMDAVARYISTEYDYESYQSDWMKMLLTGSGDCYASRAAVMNICRKIGMKATACPRYEDHGKTIVKADGKLYLVTTGYKGNKPREYDIYELTQEWFEELAEKNHIDPAYFEQ